MGIKLTSMSGGPSVWTVLRCSVSGERLRPAAMQALGRVAGAFSPTVELYETAAGIGYPLLGISSTRGRGSCVLPARAACRDCGVLMWPADQAACGCSSDHTCPQRIPACLSRPPLELPRNATPQRRRGQSGGTGSTAESDVEAWHYRQTCRHATCARMESMPVRPRCGASAAPSGRTGTSQYGVPVNAQAMMILFPRLECAPCDRALIARAMCPLAPGSKRTYSWASVPVRAAAAGVLHRNAWCLLRLIEVQTVSVLHSKVCSRRTALLHSTALQCTALPCYIETWGSETLC